MRKLTPVALVLTLAFLVSHDNRGKSTEARRSNVGERFPLEKDELATIGSNPHFVLNPVTFWFSRRVPSVSQSPCSTKQRG